MASEGYHKPFLLGTYTDRVLTVCQRNLMPSASSTNEQLLERVKANLRTPSRD
jgi:hypothetical protein